MRIILVLIFIMTSSVFASNESATIECRAKLSKVGYFGEDNLRQDFTKNLKIKKPLFNSKTKSFQLKEAFVFDFDYSVEMVLKETLNLITGKVEAILEGKLFRHRVGNGKIVLGEARRVLNFENGSFGGYINLNISNNLENLIGFQNQGVVKDAFIECSTL